MGEARVFGVYGPVVAIEGFRRISLYEVARVGEEGLLGEVIKVQGSRAFVQVYEETSGVAPGDPVRLTGEPLTVELGPGLLGRILDGLGRPLDRVEDPFLGRGFALSALDREVGFRFTPLAREGEVLSPGDLIGEVFETRSVRHRVMYPADAKPARLVEVAKEGFYRVDDVVARTERGEEIRLCSRWRIRVPRPVGSRLPFGEPLLTGTRVIDTLFPVAVGGAAVVPGGFGTGKTVTQQSLARFCAADVVIYIGCGERGNEMTEVLEEFPRLIDPRTGHSLMERTILIANTSNMPVAAREASLYLGMTIAEYYRDMGYRVALMADSTSRWAEALREISGRLEEMPGEEGYPAYLSSRLAQYYERAGVCECLGRPRREGSITVVSAVSPPGGDFSEPVTQASLRLAGAFWALDKSLAQRRHFPSIHWRNSYTLYWDVLSGWFEAEMGREWLELRDFLRWILDREAELMEVVSLVGRDALSEEDLMTLEVARLVRVFYLQQNAFDPVDSCTPLRKQLLMMRALKAMYEGGREALRRGATYSRFLSLDLGSLLRDMAAMEFTHNFEERASPLLEEISSRLARLGVV